MKILPIRLRTLAIDGRPIGEILEPHYSCHYDNLKNLSFLCLLNGKQIQANSITEHQNPNILFVHFMIIKIIENI